MNPREDEAQSSFSLKCECSLVVDETLVKQWVEKRGVQSIKLKADIQEYSENGTVVTTTVAGFTLAIYRV